MSITVTYSTEGFLHKNGGKAGKQCERSFSTVDEAKQAEPPAGYTFALILVEGGRHVYSARLGWEFQKNE